MNDQELKEVLAAAMLRVLDDAAFIFAETSEVPHDPQGWPGEVTRVRLPFSGAAGGCIRAIMTPAFGDRLAGEMTGRDPGDQSGEKQAADALGEVMNMVAGMVLEQVLGPGGDWDLGVPQVDTITAADYLARLVHAQVEVHLDTEDEEPIALALFMEE